MTITIDQNLLIDLREVLVMRAPYDESIAQLIDRVDAAYGKISRDDQRSAKPAAEMSADAKDAGRVMQSAHALCPTDLPHPDRMRWLARYFLEHITHRLQVTNHAVDSIGAALYIHWNDVNETSRNAYRKKVRAALESITLPLTTRPMTEQQPTAAQHPARAAEEIAQKKRWDLIAAEIAAEILHEISDLTAAQPQQDTTDATGLPHLHYMAQQLASRAVGSPTKACRWLGWLQAGLVAADLSTLEREKTRNHLAASRWTQLDQQGTHE